MVSSYSEHFPIMAVFSLLAFTITHHSYQMMAVVSCYQPVQALYLAVRAVFIIELLLEGGVLQKVIILIAVVIMVEVKVIGNQQLEDLHKLKSCLT
jgi:hypothetical protein